MQALGEVRAERKSKNRRVFKAHQVEHLLMCRLVVVLHLVVHRLELNCLNKTTRIMTTGQMTKRIQLNLCHMMKSENFLLTSTGWLETKLEGLCKLYKAENHLYVKLTLTKL